MHELIQFGPRECYCNRLPFSAQYLNIFIRLKTKSIVTSKFAQKICCCSDHIIYERGDHSLILKNFNLLHFYEELIHSFSEVLAYLKIELKITRAKR